MMDRIQKMSGFEEELIWILPDYVAAELEEEPLTRGLHPTDIGYFPKAKYHFRERVDGTDAHILIYCTAGKGWVELAGNQRFVISEQTLIILPAHVPHRYGADDTDPWSIYWFHLRGDDVQPLLRAFHLNEAPVSPPLGYTLKFIEAFEQIYRLLMDKPYSLQTHIHIAQTIRMQISTLGIAIGGTPHEKRRSQYIEQAIRIMSDQLDRSLKLDDLASRIGLSKQHLIELFNETTGFPPIDYFLRMKMQRASQLLDLTELSIKEIASSLGFHDPYYFSRAFKKINGISPTAYRSIKKG